MIYYFIGIKGSGMSALAQIMHDLGYNVTGSDKPDHFFTEAGLIEKGIPFHEFNPNMITKDMIIVQGNAFNDEHPEVKKAHELGLKIFTYQEMIAEITNNTKLVAVCGCHGKTTTTTMLKTVLEPFGVNYLIGDGTGYAKRGNEYFALEACEYKRHFLAYNPYYTIVTNIELDHTDYYKDLDDVMDAFNEFVSKARKAVIMCGDDENNRRIKTDKKVLYYGFNEDNDVVVKNITHDEETTKADVYINGELYDTYTFPFVGDHLLLNVLGVITVCYLENLPKDTVRKQVSIIEHAKRRFIEEKFRNNIIIDDYAHHPTEVKVTIEAARKKYPDREIVALFKAHTRSRVQYFHKEFADALNLADKAFVLDIGEDRKELGYDGVSCMDIIKDLKNGEYISLEEVDKLLPYKDTNAVLLFMSSKDIYVLENKYKEIASK
ncbi:MAG: UDP-N-acetylmuramate--L-alanine ligase [Tenericutes bacterium]|nr:UDP-N-acetylmuramate--L-alanine ligase [Mycoplasmatota bacterium]